MDELIRCTTSQSVTPKTGPSLFILRDCTILVSFVKHRRGIVILSDMSQYQFAM